MINSKDFTYNIIEGVAIECFPSFFHKFFLLYTGRTVEV